VFRHISLIVLSLFVLADAAMADVRLPGVFSDHMVLQRDTPLRVWGWADAGEKVTVKIAGRSKTCDTDADGHWSVVLAPMKAGGPHRLTVRGKNTLRVEDVLVGEVWICSGQSNMEWPVSACTDAKAEIAAGDDEQIRHFKVPHLAAGSPTDDVAAAWQPCSPRTVGRFTACGYFMARELRKKLRVPIGLINTSWGGTRIEPWIPPIGFASVPTLAATSEQVVAAAGSKPASHQQPAVLYNGMVHALVGYSMRGVIWYQGESNLGETSIYTDKMKALISGWRALWNAGDFPFFYVQIAPFKYGTAAPELLPAFWEAQANVESAVPGTGMVVTNDIATLDNIHPPNKQDVGSRLARLALNRVYGKDVPDAGPTFQQMTVEDAALRVEFEHTYGGLAARDRMPLTHFEVAGMTGGYFPAEVRIEDDALVLSSEKVPHPLVMRFAWHKLAEPNLVNGAGLPASAFRAGELPRPDSLSEIAAARGYALVYDLDLAKLSSAPTYDVDSSDAAPPEFDRIAYLLELVSEKGDLDYVWVSMDAFTDDTKLIGVPSAASGARFQQAVSSLELVSNVDLPGATEGMAGQIEFWPSNYGSANSGNVAGASTEVWDWGDGPADDPNGYGSMQVHMPAERLTVFAINHWSAGGGNADLGIGNSELDPRSTDWTFARNGSTYRHKRLRVFVRPK
jgi:sialate O-acetylesterase